MKCSCGQTLNSYNKDGICNMCFHEDNYVNIRFVVHSSSITPCWSNVEFEELLACFENYGDKDYNIFEYKCRAKRVVYIQNLIKEYNENDEVDTLIKGLLDIFFIDIMKALPDRRLVSCSSIF